jgi:hypothetical protein
MKPNDPEPLPAALRTLTKRFDWDALTDRMLSAEGVSRNAKDVTVINTDGADLPLEEAYGWFHAPVDNSPAGAELIGNWLAATRDEDRLHFAEDYATLVLAVTGIDDANWFRRGVWLKETIPEIQYSGQRDHSVHTLHNYLLGWHFFTNSDAVKQQFLSSFKRRGMDVPLVPELPFGNAVRETPVSRLSPKP